MILHKYRHLFGSRNAVDLKDKWRNIERNLARRERLKLLPLSENDIVPTSQSSIHDRTGCARTLNPRVTNTKDMKEIAVGHNDGGLQGGKEQNLATNSCDKEQKAKPAGDNENEIVTSAGGT